MLQVLNTAKQDDGNKKQLTVVRQVLRKSGLDSRLMEFLPANKRTEDHFAQVSCSVFYCSGRHNWITAASRNLGDLAFHWNYSGAFILVKIQIILFEKFLLKAINLKN